MIVAALLPWVQFVPAFLTLDLFFRTMNLAPVGLALRLRRYAAAYSLVALACCALAVWLQWRLGGRWGAAFAPLNAAPWWMLWKFGLRKQLTYLFKDDGGHALDIQKTDPS